MSLLARCHHGFWRAVRLTFTGVGLAAALAAGASVGSAKDAANTKPVEIVAFGDSLTAGYGLKRSDAFPVKLQAALRAKGYKVNVANAGVSGDTLKGGLARLDWAVPPTADAVIVELGANDALRGVAAAESKKSLDSILSKLQASGKEVLVAGMLAPPNFGKAYADTFEGMYPELAEKYGALLYPFFLDGVATKPELNLADGLHPNAEGVDVIVARILPWVEKLIARARAKQKS